MYRLLIIFSLLFITTVLFCKNNYRLENQRKYKLVKTLSETKLPIIRIEIKGQEYNFLIASGVTLSLIDSASALNHKLDITLAKKPGEILTFGGMQTRTKVVSLMGHHFYVQEMNKMIKDLEFHTGIKIDGLIGYDLLSSTNSVIDIRQEIIFKAY